MVEVLGIDIGGTNVKISTVNKTGEILDKQKYPTKPLYEEGIFLHNFISIVQEQLHKNKKIAKVGIGVPGTISKDRKSIINLPNIPGMNDTPIISELEKNFPQHEFYLENDATAAALGEYTFSEIKLPDDITFITLGTGVGGGAILNGKVFAGGDGNAMELGHIIASNGNTIEKNIGKQGLLSYANALLEESTLDSLLKNEQEFGTKEIIKAAKKGDEIALKVFKYMGKYLGECIVSSIRILDIKFILIGGGVSKAGSYIEESMWDVIHTYLPKSYTDNLEIKIATKGNEAGVLGAAALCFQ